MTDRTLQLSVKCHQSPFCHARVPAPRSHATNAKVERDATERLC